MYDGRECFRDVIVREYERSGIVVRSRLGGTEVELKCEEDGNSLS
jgi:hypothetical protein